MATLAEAVGGSEAAGLLPLLLLAPITAPAPLPEECLSQLWALTAALRGEGLHGIASALDGEGGHGDDTAPGGAGPETPVAAHTRRR